MWCTTRVGRQGATFRYALVAWRQIRSADPLRWEARLSGQGFTRMKTAFVLWLPGGSAPPVGSRLAHEAKPRRTDGAKVYPPPANAEHPPTNAVGKRREFPATGPLLQDTHHRTCPQDGTGLTCRGPSCSLVRLNVDSVESRRKLSVGHALRHPPMTDTASPSRRPNCSAASGSTSRPWI